MPALLMSILASQEFIGFIGGLLSLIFVLLNAKVGRYLEQKINNEAAQDMTKRLNDAVWKAVGEVSQTYVDSLKASASDGKLTAEEAAEAKRRAIAAAKLYLGAKGVAELMRVFGWTQGEAEAQIASNVEAVLGLQKAPSARIQRLTPVARIAP